MLKINLLPPYIYEKRRVRMAALLFGVLLLGIVAAMMGWYVLLCAKQRQLAIQVADMEQKANEVRQLEAQAQAEEQKIPRIESKVDFIEGVMAYNLMYPKLYEELAKYTYSRIVYQSVEPAAGELKMTAHARSVGDCGRYLLNMYRASHVFSSVTISSVPGWPREGAGGGGDRRGFDFSVTCRLAKPIAAPSYVPGQAPAAPGMLPAPGVPSPGAEPVPMGEPAPGVPAPRM